MSWRKELTSLVTASSGVTALIGNRFYAAKAPVKAGSSQPDFPFATYRTVAVRNTNSKSGPSTLEFRTIQIDAQAADTQAAEAVYRAIRAAIENYASTTGEIRRIVYETDREDYNEDNRAAIIQADYLLTLSLT